MITPTEAAGILILVAIVLILLSLGRKRKPPHKHMFGTWRARTNISDVFEVQRGCSCGKVECRQTNYGYWVKCL